MSTNARVQCKGCNVWMPRLEWMTKKECENPNCKCPMVKDAMRKTQQVIETAQGNRFTNQIKVTTASMPTDRNTKRDQYWIDVPQVMVISITPPNIKGARGK